MWLFNVTRISKSPEGAELRPVRSKTAHQSFLSSQQPQRASVWFTSFMEEVVTNFYSAQNVPFHVWTERKRPWRVLLFLCISFGDKHSAATPRPQAIVTLRLSTEWTEVEVIEITSTQTACVCSWGAIVRPVCEQDYRHVATQTSLEPWTATSLTDETVQSCLMGVLESQLTQWGSCQSWDVRSDLRVNRV